MAQQGKMRPIATLGRGRLAIASMLAVLACGPARTTPRPNGGAARSPPRFTWQDPPNRPVGGSDGTQPPEPPEDDVGPAGCASLATADAGPATDAGALSDAGDVQGQLAPELIKREIRGRFPKFRRCYEAALHKDPSVKGSVAVRFIIALDGSVESASHSSGSITDPEMIECIVARYRKLCFPRPVGGKVMVTYPIDFQNDP